MNLRVAYWIDGALTQVVHGNRLQKSHSVTFDVCYVSLMFIVLYVLHELQLL